MAMKWLEPTVPDLKQFMQQVVVDRVSQDEDQSGKVLTAVVQRIRGTIDAANVTPVSRGTGEVPPEGFQHALVLAVFALVTSTPNMQFVTKEEFDKLWKAAEDWLRFVQECGKVAYPTELPDDFDADTAGPVRWGSESEEVDTSTA